MEPKPNKNDSLEALDFIINVLKEHEKDLDRFISQLGIITESLGETGEIAGKIENIEDRISTLQDEITTLVKNIPATQTASSAQARFRSCIFRAVAAGLRAYRFGPFPSLSYPSCLP